METVFASVLGAASNLCEAVRRLEGVVESKPRAVIHQRIEQFLHVYDDMARANHQGRMRDVVRLAHSVADHGRIISTAQEGADQPTMELVGEIGLSSTFLRSTLDTLEVNLDAAGTQRVDMLDKLDKASADIDKIAETIAAFESRYGNLQGLQRELTNDFGSLKVQYEHAWSKAHEAVKEKAAQIDGILGQGSSRFLAADYHKSAEVEETAADFLRIAAMGTMAVVGVLLIILFYQSSQPTFQWDVAIMRFVIVAVLSAPAAYLARESSKHRSQQYHFLQMSLDLKAIDPYLASLEPPERQKIKTDIATRLFSGHAAPTFKDDVYPINVQELLMEIVKSLRAAKPRNWR